MDDELELMGAYVAGVIDATGSISVQVKKDSSRLVGYAIVPTIQIKKNDPRIIHVLDNWAQEHNVFASIRETDTTTTFIITKREDLETFLRSVRPFVIVKSDQIEITLHEILPRLDDGAASTKEGFVELMEYVDMVRDQSGPSSRHKYDKSYFEEEWAAEI